LPLLGQAGAQYPPDAPLAPTQVETTRRHLQPCTDDDPVEKEESKPVGEANDQAIPAAPLPAKPEGLVPCVSYARTRYLDFIDGPRGKPRTPRNKAWLAARNVIDPFELVTVFGDSAIATAANARSAYGPGVSGFGRRAGISFSQEATVELVDTFAICTIAHQNPTYQREPNAPIPRRVAHAVLQAVRAESDDGNYIPNYANLVGFAIDDEIANLYVPGRETNARASAERYGAGLLSAPVGNLVTEFLPTIAKRIHVRVVIIQRLIDHVAKTGSAGAP
jgi:hypothetical protein